MIRQLDAVADRDAVAGLMAQSQDYWQLWKGRAPDASDVEEYFTSIPPGQAAGTTLHLGLGDSGTLLGLAEVFFGFPGPQDAYLGLLILVPAARSAGRGAGYVRQIETLCRTRGATHLYLAVLEANPRGAAFWARMGFAPTGVSRRDTDHAVPHLVHRLGKAL